MTPSGESDRLKQIARVTQRADQVFESAEQSRAWLNKASPALRGAAPLDLLVTDESDELVTEELVRIDYGDLY